MNESQLYTIKPPTGPLIHTHISTGPVEAIEDFLETQRVMMQIYNMGAKAKFHKKPVMHGKSWEQYEAEGYSVVPIKDIEQA